MLKQGYGVFEDSNIFAWIEGIFWLRAKINKNSYL